MAGGGGSSEGCRTPLPLAVAAAVAAEGAVAAVAAVAAGWVEGGPKIFNSLLAISSNVGRSWGSFRRHASARALYAT